ncbi:MAG: HAD-IA family hydrolase [Pseudomonadota bacterium]
MPNFHHNATGTQPCSYAFFSPAARTVPTRFVYFDLDDTLLDHHAAQDAALAALHADFAAHFDGHDLTDVQSVYASANRRLWQAYGEGRITRHDVQRERFGALVDAFDLTGITALALGEHYMERYAEAWCWMDGAKAAFLAVADRYPVGILTNGFAEAQHAKLDRFPVLRDRAAAIVVSEEVGVMKPRPGIFAHATEATGVSPAEVLYIGDSWHSDVEGGTAFGWHVAWFRGDVQRAEGRSGVTVLSNWSDLGALLGESP